jgi:hypothetical protein
MRFTECTAAAIACKYCACVTGIWRGRYVWHTYCENDAPLLCRHVLCVVTASLHAQYVLACSESVICNYYTHVMCEVTAICMLSLYWHVRCLVCFLAHT